VKYVLCRRRGGRSLRIKESSEPGLSGPYPGRADADPLARRVRTLPGVRVAAGPRPILTSGQPFDMSALRPEVSDRFRPILLKKSVGQVDQGGAVRLLVSGDMEN